MEVVSTLFPNFVFYPCTYINDTWLISQMWLYKYMFQFHKEVKKMSYWVKNIRIFTVQQHERWPTQHQPRPRNISAWQSRRLNYSTHPIAVNYSGRRRSVIITKKGWQSQGSPERTGRTRPPSSSLCGSALMKTHWLLPNLPANMVAAGATVFP